MLGDARTAEELGRALPGVPVRTSSSGDRVLATVDDTPAIVVATPGAEPVADGGYAAVLLLDTWLLLGRADLRATEEAVRRWANAAALVRPVSEGGRVLVVGEPSHPGLQALVRWDPGGLARREIDERQSAHLPPASRVATITGDPDDLEAALPGLALPAGAEVLGPVPVEVPWDGRDHALRRRAGALRRPGPARGRGGPVRRAGGAAGPSLHPQAAAPAGRGRPGRTRLRSPNPSLLHWRTTGFDRPHAEELALSIRPIRMFGDPVLRTPALPVVDFDKELRTLVQDLTDTMIEAPGSGLAAPQLGVGMRVFTWHVDGELGHLVNPQLTLSEEIQDGPEGCLSIPGFSIDCKRALSVVAHGFDMYGEPLLVEGSEMLARAIQHETDHLDGIIFVDRLDREARKEAMKFIREADWFGEPTPQVKFSPHATNGLGI